MRSKHKKRSGITLLSYFFVVITIIYLLIPLIATGIYSVFENWTGIIPRGFSFQSYIDLFQDELFIKSIFETIVICIVPIVLTSFVVLLALFATLVYFPRFEKYLQLICVIPYTIQGVILSVSILGLYVEANGILSNRLVMLTGAYCIIILPYIYQGIRNGMQAIHMTTLLEAAEMLGCSKIKGFFKIIVPNILSGVITSSLLAVGIIFGDYVLIRNLAGSQISNMQIYLYQAMKTDSMKSSAVFVIIMLITFIIAVIVLNLSDKKKTVKNTK
ncbi:MAG TPA: ABC transporter permease subunit [Clostridiaceae bacterium]|nr:ABC transporter permease subunit [Clostridiaceae bacterium]